MKRSRCKALIAVATLLLGAVNAPLGAQAAEAALFLLLPVSARAVGMGQAMASMAGSADAVWWNPAGIANAAGVHTSLHHSQSLIGTGDALGVSVRTSLGVVAISANLLDFGAGQVTGPDTVPAGQLFPRNIALGASYAVAVRGVRLGATYRAVQSRFDCSGECPPIPSTIASANTFDVGAQYDLPTPWYSSVGVSVRSLGPRTRDGSGDRGPALPTRLQVGGLVRYRVPTELADDVQVSVAVDLLNELRSDKTALPRVGAEFAWEGTVFVRGGYVRESDDAAAGGAAIGLGFVVRRLTIDFARNFTGLSADAGQPPTFLSIRASF